MNELPYVAISVEQTSNRYKGHRLFSVFSIVASVVVFAGFARTFFLRVLFAPRALPLYLYVHGLLFTSWFILFFIQVRLIAAQRADLHRRLGVLTAGVGGLAIPVALGVAIHAGKRVYQLHAKPFSLEACPLALDLGACLAFTVFVATALFLRRRTDSHKRLMLLASCSILLPAFGRTPTLLQAYGLWGLVGFTEIVPVAFIVYDTVRHRRLHPTFGWGGLGVVASWPTFLLIGSTHYWLRFTEWLVRV